MAKRLSSEEQFEQHFAAIYNERWPSLRAALLLEPTKVVMENPFGRDSYTLDPASRIPVLALDLSPGQTIADFCASPGGKSICSIFTLKGQAQWFCNDLSPGRVQRLKAVLHDCLPAEVLARVRVSCSDASRWGMRRSGEFDRILVDAPCSGERHLLASAKELARWSAKGSKRLSMRQHALLCSAIDCLRPGGKLVYSTCSISPIENDGVVAKLLKSRPGLTRVIAAPTALELGIDLEGETTELGQIFLPDRCAAGPIYFSVIERVIERIESTQLK